MSVDAEFAQTSPGSAVHILRPDGEPADVPLAAGLASWAMAGHPIGVTLCGRGIRLVDGGSTVDTFADDRLCRRCYDLWDGDPADLFTHPTPG